MKSRSATIALTITAALGVSLGLTSAASASTSSVVQQCGQGHPASYRLTTANAAFLGKYLRCVLVADGLGAKTTRTVPVFRKGCTNVTGCSANFDALMAPTITSFAEAPKSADNVKYINAKLAVVYHTIQPPTGDWYTIWGDTRPPSLTLAAVAEAIAPAHAPIVRGWSRAPRLAIDIVVQNGTWFHGGSSNNLRYMILIDAV